MKLGQTGAGRHLQVVYVPDKGGESAFVITACELKAKALKALPTTEEKAPVNKNTTSTNNKGRKRPTTGKGKQRFPRGWNEKKVREVIAHYDQLTDEERAAEIEAAAEAPGDTLMAVPTALVPAVLKLIKRHEKSA